MTADRWSQILRTGTLVALLGVFCWFLISGLVHDQQAKGFGRLTEGQGRDKGIRVLLMNRMPPDGAIATHDKAQIEILQPVEVWAPDNPDQKPETLKAGATLRIELLGIDGFLLSSQDWAGGPRELKWAVQSVYLVPRDTEPVVEHLDNDGKAIFPDPRTYEAANRRGVFRLVGTRPDLKPQYRGSLQVLWRSPKELALINHLPVESYLEGVVAVEMSPAYPLEALKAQAIASRGFAACKAAWASQNHQPWDLSDSSGADQAYNGAGYSTSAIIRAIFDTRGIVPTLHGAPFLPFFSASSGGYTESVDNVYPNMRDLYGREPLCTVMLAQRDEACERGVAAMNQQATHWQTTVDLRPQEDLQYRLATYLARWNRQIGYIMGVRVGRRDPRSNRVQTVVISHSNPDSPIEIPAKDFRDLLGPGKLRSTLWTNDSPKKVEVAKNKFVWRITTIGWGHGLGLSQISAAQLANEGMSANDILKRFYAGVELRTW